MELKDIPIINRSSHRSGHKRGHYDSIPDSIDMVSTALQKMAEGEIRDVLNSESGKMPRLNSPVKQTNSCGSARAIPIEPIDPTLSKKAEFGDSRPVVKKVWDHYPFQEVPPLPKDPREALNKMLNRRKSTFAQVFLETKEEKDSVSSNEELEMRNNCHFQMFPILVTNRPTSADAKIDSKTKLPIIEESDDKELARAKREGIDLSKLDKKGTFNYDLNNSKFLRTDEKNNLKHIFKIKKQVRLNGVLNDNIWKRIPVSPHLDTNSVSPDMKARRNSLRNPLNAHHQSYQGKMSLFKGIGRKEFTPKIPASLDATHHVNRKAQAKEDSNSPNLPKTSSVKGIQHNHNTASLSAFAQRKLDFKGFNNQMDFGLVRNSTGFTSIVPPINNLEHIEKSQPATVDAEGSKLNRQPFINELVKKNERGFSTAEEMGLVRRSVSIKKGAKVVIYSTMTKGPTRRFSVSKNHAD